MVCLLAMSQGAILQSPAVDLINSGPGVSEQRRNKVSGVSVREPPFMMSTKFSAFLTPPLCLHLELLYTIKFTQPPLLPPIFHDPPPMQTSYLKAPLYQEYKDTRKRYQVTYY